jgi:uncharacterized protein YecE (DUF72 family)
MNKLMRHYQHNLYIGASGWHYGHWRGRFYPEELPPREWLSFYAREFSCVELNNSFYKLPKPAVIQTWVEQTPSSFRFAVKASRFITHMKKLRNCGEALQTFLDIVHGLGNKLGPILFQLPSHWHVNPGRLQEFLQSLPRKQRFAFEFRDLSWHVPEIYECLNRYDAAFCQFDLGGFQSPCEITADFVYIRLHGPAAAYSGSYSAHSLRIWADRLCLWRSQGKDVYLFFDNDQAGYAAHNAKTLQHFCTFTNSYYAGPVGQ